MGILKWDKPKKKLSAAQWKESAGFDGGPDGGYSPNMSEDDALAWKAKITGTKIGYPQVEIRKQAGDSLMLIIVNLGAGYNYKQYRAEPDMDEAKKSLNFWHSPSISSYRQQTGKVGMVEMQHVLTEGTRTGVNVHMSMNGPATFTFDDFNNLQLAIAEAKEALEALDGVPGERHIYHVYMDGNPDDFHKNLSKVPGTRVHYSVPGPNFVVVSAAESELEQINKIEGVTRIRTFAEAKAEADALLR